MKLTTLSIGGRLYGGFAVVLVVLAAVAALGLACLGHVQDTLRGITQVDDQEAVDANEMRQAVGELSASARDVILLTDAVETQAVVAHMKDMGARYDAAERRLAALYKAAPATTKEQADVFAEVAKAKAATWPSLNEVTGMAVDNKFGMATKIFMMEVKPAQAAWTTALGKLVAIGEKHNAQAVADAEVTYGRARASLLLLSALAVVAGMLAAWAITRSVVRPLARAVDVARTVAAGDLTSHVGAHGGDETGVLLRTLGEMNASLANVVRVVREGSDAVATGSTQIASGNADLSLRTEQMAGSLEETAASVEELTATVRSNSATAHQASAMAAAASETATRGGRIVASVVSTMGEIDVSARQIAEIIGVIDGIAFQTNILALNAAVEAARAGEQGRGFAVVAAEVRSLAKRSAEAARSIKGLIDTSSARVEAGMSLVGEAGTAMASIVDRVAAVAHLIAEISVAASEQATGIVQVSEAVTHLDRVTQQNAALVEQSAAAAESLSRQAAVMVDAVKVFRLR